MKKEKLNTKMLKSTSGITLLALVVTIIVLLILAGVSINIVLGKNGIFSKAQDSKYTMEKAVLKDKIETIKLNWEADRIIDSSIGIERLWEDLKNAEIIDSVEDDVKKQKEETLEDGKIKTTYEISTKDGYDIIIIEVKDENGNIEVSVDEIINNEKALPKVSIKLSDPTTNGVTVKAEVRRAEGKLIYSYKLEEETEYTKYAETEETQITITGLQAYKTYEIKVEAINENGTSSDIQKIRTVELEKATVILEEEKWNNGTATIKISTTSSYTLQYQVDGLEEIGWKNYSDIATTGITGLKHGQTVYTRIFDGTNSSKGADFVIIDKVEPTVTINNNVTKTTKSITVSVTSNDLETGMPEIIIYNFYIKKTSDTDYSLEPTETKTATSGSTETSYTFDNLEAGISYDVKVTAQDKAENTGIGTKTGISTNQISGASEGLQEGSIVVNGPVWSNGTASIELSTNTELNIQYQVNAKDENNWKEYTSSGITGLKHNDTIYARLTDGKNTGKEASSYTDGTFSSNGQKISKTVSKGTYYIHVLTLDKAGNTTETVKGPITVVQKVTGVSLSQTNAELEKDATLKLTATVTPTSANNTNVNWSSSNTSVATVSTSSTASGTAITVTAKGEGTATITATATDGSGNSASCSVTVKEQYISTTESFVKYYADADGDGTVDSVIFADMVADGGATGQWNNSDGAYTISTVSSSAAKSYKIIKDSYNGKFGTAPVLQSSSTTGKDRFYVMALSDLDSSQYCWYYSANNNYPDYISDYSTITSGDFGAGKQNTANMISRWNSSYYGKQNGKSGYPDVWGVVQTQFNDTKCSWFVPSSGEWAAFADAFNITSSNYLGTYNLNDWYVSSTLVAKNYATYPNFYHEYMWNDGIGAYTNVRLCATF